jgi:hypothetical protein
MSIHPAELRTWNPIWPWQHSGKTWTVVCGKCLTPFKAVIPVAEHQSAACPQCCEVNRWKVEIEGEDE